MIGVSAASLPQDLFGRATDQTNVRMLSDDPPRIFHRERNGRKVACHRFDPITLGTVTAKNRILMAPLTRARATMDHVPTPMMIDYYRQRANAGLIISEATGISAQGLGWPYAPGIWNAEQVDAWRSITAAVHGAGGLMFAQLWHMGNSCATIPISVLTHMAARSKIASAFSSK